MVSNVKISTAVPLDAGIKTPNQQFCGIFLTLLGYPLTLELY